MFSAHAHATPEPAAQPGVTVTILQDGLAASYVTRAKTVADFLAERNIVPGPADTVSPSQQTVLIEGMRIDVHGAFPVSLQVGRERHDVMTTAQTVGDFLAAQNIALGKDDHVQPALQESLHAGSVVHVSHESAWIVHTNQRIPYSTVHRYDPRIAPGHTKTVAGSAGLLALTTRYVQHDDDSLQEQIVATHIVRPAHPKVVLLGIGEYAAFAMMARRGFDATIKFAVDAMNMVATAYTASCAGCSGYTASGKRAGHGIVAVDPRVIPLGTRLYIPGYGPAIAGDTGGAINGHRIDLGFNSEYDALQFGRRSITVYVLR